jgi:aminoglycoside phosphotransferase (APT) family kinase protein
MDTRPARDEERIQADLGAVLGQEVRDVRPIPEGHSGFTYWVELPSGLAVLRLPPPGARIAGPADIPRQARVLDALHRAGVPVPRVLASSSETAVDGRPFYLVEAIDGRRIEVEAEQASDADIAGSAVDVLLRMQAVPVPETGIGDEAATGLAQEVERWSWLLERAPEELTGEAPGIAARLQETRPAERPPVLVHGDYHYGNMLFREGRVVALLDWEIAQLGQPLLDLACLGMVAREQDVGVIPGGGAVRVPEDDLLRWYGAEAAEFRWFLALTYYKYAGIFGYNLMLHRRGKRPDPIYETRTGTIMEFIAEAGRILDE